MTFCSILQNSIWYEKTKQNQNQTQKTKHPKPNPNYKAVS